MVNQSVVRFKALTGELRKEVHDQAVKELNNQAQILAGAIKSAAKSDKGNLRASVNVVQGKKDTQVSVVAGGKLTTRTTKAGKSYDYSRADEFGTQEMPAQPFFFTTYRLLKSKIKSTMKRRLSKSIKDRSSE